MINTAEMELICCFIAKKRHYDVYRNTSGKYFVRINGAVIQKALTSREIIRWFGNAMNDE